MRSFSYLRLALSLPSILFFFNDTATTEIYTLSLHDALPISAYGVLLSGDEEEGITDWFIRSAFPTRQEVDDVLGALRSEEHTSELQSRQYLVCRLLLEKKQT